MCKQTFNQGLHPEIYDNLFKIEQPVNIDYITRPNPSNKKQYIVTERTVYRSLGGFLKAELYRSLVAGNAPRVCDNCGRYFLIIGQKKTLCCNRVASNVPKGRLCLKYALTSRLKNCTMLHMRRPTAERMTD